MKLTQMRKVEEARNGLGDINHAFKGDEGSDEVVVTIQDESMKKSSSNLSRLLNFSQGIFKK